MGGGCDRGRRRRGTVTRLRSSVLPSFLFASKVHGGERGYRSHSWAGGASPLGGSAAALPYSPVSDGELAQPSLCLDLLFSKV